MPTFSDAVRPHTVVGPGAVPVEWTDVCGFVKHPNSCDVWKIRPHGAVTIPRETLGLRQRDQSGHHEVRLVVSWGLSSEFSSAVWSPELSRSTRTQDASWLRVRGTHHPEPHRFGSQHHCDLGGRRGCTPSDKEKVVSKATHASVVQLGSTRAIAGQLQDGERLFG